AASHHAVRDAEQHENAKAEALRGRTFTILAEDKLRRCRSRLRRDPRGQNGNHNRRHDADEPKQCVGRPPRQDQQQTCCRRWQQDLTDVASEIVSAESLERPRPLNARVTSAEPIGCCVAAPTPPRNSAKTSSANPELRPARQ